MTVPARIARTRPELPSPDTSPPATPLLEAGVFLAEAMHRPAEVALAALLEDRLAAVVDRGHHVGGSDDAAVLHEFRVALRRLRSLIRVYGSLLEDVIPLRLRRELRRVARATNASRDLDVKLKDKQIGGYRIKITHSAFGR